MVLVLPAAGRGGLTARPAPLLREHSAACDVMTPRRKSSPARALISASGEQLFLSAAISALRARPDPHTMQNDAGEFVDLYVPRKCV
ncbi:40S ribosomal protein S21 isoform X1 [Phasianus colchicus]|uniref:40S ribosomal protein S21 isoform X1 n=1 Tax=Phasianus colchicus TaxID=9054 RepID=UPI00129EB1B4|nr:40S ribosomal protein S21 isoform X1 [Phasianus colchicus]